MRIGILCHSSFGGSARIATELAIALSERGHRVHVFTQSTSILRGDAGANTNIVLHTSKTDLFPPSPQLHAEWSESEQVAYLQQILKVIAHDGLDIIHFHYAVPFAFILANLKRTLQGRCPRLVGTLHGTDVTYYGQQPKFNGALAKALQSLNGLTTVSEHYATLAQKIFQLPAPPEVIPNFIHSNQLPNQGHHAVSKPLLSYKPIIIHISNFRPVKDTQTVAKIFVGIRQQLASQLWLIGDGPDLPQVQQDLSNTPFFKDVHFWGLQSNVREFLKQANLLLMTSRAESFCLVALEALSCGVPVLSTAVGGIPELIKDGVTGCLFPLESTDQAVRSGLKVLTNPSVHQSMQIAGIRHANQYSHTLIVPRYEFYYQALLDNKQEIKMVQDSDRAKISAYNFQTE